MSQNSQATEAMVQKLTNTLQAKESEIEELEKKLRHLEFTNSQEISRLTTLFDSEKQRSDLLEKSLKEIGSLQNLGSEGESSLEKLKEENSLLHEQKQEAENKLRDVQNLVMEALKEKDAHIESLQEHATTMKAVYKKQMEFCSEELKRLEAENLQLQNKAAIGGEGRDEEHLLQKISELEENSRLAAQEKMMIDKQFQSLMAKYEEQTGNYEVELNHLKAELEERMTERDRLYEQLAGTKDVKHELISEIEKVEEKLRTTERTYAEQAREFEKKEKSLQGELKEAQRNLKEKIALCEESSAALTKVKESERELQSQKEGFTLKIKQLEEQVKRLDTARENELIRACNLETEEKKLKLENKNLNQKLKKCDEQMKELNAMFEEKERTLAARINELEITKRKEKEEHDSQVAVLNAEKLRLLSIVNAARNEDAKDSGPEFRTRSTTITDSMAPINNEASALAQELEEAYNLTQSSTAESEKIDRLEGELKALQSELKHMKESRENDNEGEKIKALTAEHSKKIVGLMTELDLLKVENIKLQGMIKCVEVQKDNQVQYLEKEMAFLEKAMANTKLTLVQVTCEKELIETQYNKLLKRLGGK